MSQLDIIDNQKVEIWSYLSQEMQFIKHLVLMDDVDVVITLTDGIL